MYKGDSIAVIIPAHNEERLIGATLEDIPEYVDSILVTDDASSDGTAAAVEKLACADPRIKLIKHASNQGKGASVMDGWRLAIEMGRDVTVLMDGDHQMSPEHLPALLDRVIDGKFDAAKGNRFLDSPGSLEMPRYRLIGNIVLTLLTKAASGYWSVFDSQNGYWAIRTDSLKKMDMGRIARRYDFENSLLIQLNIANARLADVPIPARYGEEASGIRLWSLAPRLLVTLFAGFWRRIFLKYVLYGFHPIALFLFSGLGLMFAGGVIGAYVVIHSIGPTSATAGSVMLAVLPFLTGFQLLLAAMVLDILNEPK